MVCMDAGHTTHRDTADYGMHHYTTPMVLPVHGLSTAHYAPLSLWGIIMSATPNVPTIDASTDAWADYDAVINGGMSKAERARNRGITAATVGANVKRVVDAITAGATVPTGTTSTDDGPSTYTTHTAIMSLIDAPTFDAFGAVVVGAFDNVVRTADAHTAAVERRDAVCTRLGIDATAVDALVGTTVPTPDAPTDAS